MARPVIGIYDRHWDVLGGGERYAADIATALRTDGDVVLLGWGDDPRPALSDRLGLDLTWCEWRAVTDEPRLSAETRHLDVFVSASLGSMVVNRSRFGAYVVHFPHPRDLDRVPAVAHPAVGRLLAGVPRAALPRRLRRLVDDARPVEGTPRTVLGSYQVLLSNSEYVASWVTELWGLPSVVLEPAVAGFAALDKDRTIVHLGRFMDPAVLHAKRQLEMVRAFRRLHDRGAADGWRLQLVGSVDRTGHALLEEVRAEARDLPVEIHTDVTHAALADLVGRASIQWHLTGLGASPDQHPEAFEHFGIAVVEGMSAGVVPVVLSVGGPASIVRDGIDGVHVDDLDALVDATARLVTDPERRHALAASAVQRAARYDSSRFERRLRSALGRDDVHPDPDQT